MDNSTIPGAGRGLFSLVARPVGFPLVDYMGELISAEETERRYPKNTSGTYCLQLTNSFYIDSALSRGVGALVNHPGKGMKPNVKFVVDRRKKSARLEVSEKLKAGDEIFVDYGEDYWEDAKKSSHFTVDIPDWEWDVFDPFASVSPPSGPSITSVSGPNCTVAPAVVVAPSQPVPAASPSQPVPAASRGPVVAPDAVAPSTPVAVVSPIRTLAVLPPASTPEVFDFTDLSRPSAFKLLITRLWRTQRQILGLFPTARTGP